METTDPRDAPWWLAPGSARCPHCLRRYHAAVGYRCVDCDGPVCPFCVVTARREELVIRLCPDCDRASLVR